MTQSLDLSMIADDLSGACDSSVEFLDGAKRVCVLVDSDDPASETPSSEGLVVWNTESRHLAPQEAYAKVRRATAQAAAAGTRVFFKKTDSAFRGHFGLEIGAAMDELDVALCCLAPANPDGGRVTRHGIQYIDGAPIARTFYQNDPLHPVRNSSALAAAESGSRRRAGLIELEQVRRGEAAARLREILGAGARIAVADAETVEDQTATVEAVLAHPGRLLFVGGQGLARALAICLAKGEAAAPGPEKHAEGMKNGAEAERSPRPALSPAKRGLGRGIAVFCGSPHPRSRAQLAHAARRVGARIVRIQAPSPPRPEALQSEAARVAEACALDLETAGLALLATPESLGAPADVLEILMAEAASRLWERFRLAGLVLTGGSTAYAICRRLGVRRLVMRSRLAPAVSLAEAPELGGAAMAVKGGSLGAEDVLDAITDAIRTGASRRS